MAQSAISLCSKALIKLGAQPIVSFYENTAEAQVALQLYEQTRDALLSSYPWRFATSQVRLNRLNNSPTADYTYSYQLPNDFLRALSAGTGKQGRGLSYRICKRTLQCNAPEVILTYIYNPTEENFPPFFEQVLISRLAAEFCLPLTENTSRAQMLEKSASDNFMMAKLIDSQQSAPPAIMDFPLIGVRL